jgi:hypothetical protein
VTGVAVRSPPQWQSPLARETQSGSCSEEKKNIFKRIIFDILNYIYIINILELQNNIIG